MHNWILLAIVSAVLLSITNVATKHLNSTLDEYATGWLRNSLSLPILWLLLLSVGFPSVDPIFWKLIVISLPIEIVIVLLFFKSVKIAPLSLVAPINSLGAFFVAIGAFFILSEPLSLLHILAFISLAIGVYVLNLQSMRGGFFRPFLQIKKERGVLMMLTTSILFGITVPIGKLLSGYSSPQFYVAVYYSLFVLLFTPVFLRKTKNRISDIKKSLLAIMVMGASNGLFLYVVWRALSSGPAGPVTAIQATSVLMTVIMAGKFFNEKRLLQRFIAACIIVLGAALAVLA
ncbi:MAG: DMT family transporter [Patescibacteria group bacterium]